jgi:hypothetical protein
MKTIVKLILALLVLNVPVVGYASIPADVTGLSDLSDVHLGMGSDSFRQFRTNVFLIAMFESPSVRSNCPMYCETNLPHFKQVIYEFQNKKLRHINFAGEVKNESEKFFQNLTDRVNASFGAGFATNRMVLSGRPPKPTMTRATIWKKSNSGVCLYKTETHLSLAIFDPSLFDYESLFVSEKMAADLKKIQERIDNQNLKK